MAETKNNDGLEAVVSFFKKDLWTMLILFLKEPISGTYSLFAEKKDRLFPSIILMAVTFVLYVCLPLILMGKYIGFGDALKFGLFPVIYMLFVTLITFGLKFISDKPDIKAELFTGAMQALPLLFLFILVLILKIFGEDVASSMMRGNLMGSMVLSIIMVYLLLMMINIVIQSLKASNAKDALAWYVSPAVILLSFYLTSKIAGAMF